MRHHRVIPHSSCKTDVLNRPTLLLSFMPPLKLSLPSRALQHAGLQVPNHAIARFSQLRGKSGHSEHNARQHLGTQLTV